MDTGDLDLALGQYREAARLRPAPFTYNTWIHSSFAADRPDEAEAVLQEAAKLGFDSPALRDGRVRLAFLRNDTAAMEQQWAWAEGRPEAASLFSGKANVEATYGRVREALASLDKAGALAAAAGSPWTYDLDKALLRAQAGLPPAGPPITIAPTDSLSTRVSGSLVLARTGHAAEAKVAANALRSDFPTNTVIQKYALPVIDGAVALASNDPRATVIALEPAVKYDFVDTDVAEALWPAYLRGLARLAVGEAALAAAEFQKILDHPGLLGRGIMGPMARLQLARAQRAAGDDSASLASYETLLDLWKNADADLPVYLDAKAEHEALSARLASAQTSR
jgi:pentatricopeptide repeat protein